MRHAGARESLPQRISDFALVADHQRAHLGVFRISKIAIEELADVRPYRFNLACGEARTMPDDLKDRRTERLASRSHRRGDAVARHQSHVIELAGIAVVARKMDARSQPDFVAQLETPAPEHRDSDIAARLRHRRTLLGGAIDGDVNSVSVSFMLGLTIDAAFDRDARTVDERRDTARVVRRLEHIRNRHVRGKRDCYVSRLRARASGAMRAMRRAPIAATDTASQGEIVK